MDIISELARVVRDGLLADLSEIGEEARDWRPVPDSNTIGVIVRHLRIEEAPVDCGARGGGGRRVREFWTVSFPRGAEMMR